MSRTRWFTLGAAAALFAATPALASDAPCSCCAGGEHAAAAKAAPGHAAEASGRRADGRTVGRKVEVSVTEAGFVPAVIPAKGGEVLSLVVTRKVERTCVTELVQAEQGVAAPLPLGEAVVVTLQAPRRGQLAFSCAHGHVKGAIVAQ